MIVSKLVSNSSQLAGKIAQVAIFASHHNNSGQILVKVSIHKSSHRYKSFAPAFSSRLIDGHSTDFNVSPCEINKYATVAKESDLIHLTKKLNFSKCQATLDNEKSSSFMNKHGDHSLATQADADGVNSSRKLVVMMSWLNARERHIKCYRNYYLERGFDVLNLKTSPLDLLLPHIGSAKSTRDLVDFLSQHNYPKVLIHGFSIGGFNYGQLVDKLNDLGDKKRQQIMSSLNGVIFDSIVPIEGAFIGVANTITDNPLIAQFIANLARSYLYLNYVFAGRRINEVSKIVWSGPTKCPALFINSKNDQISDFEIVSRLKDTWRKLGINTMQFVVDDAPHVQIWRSHRDAYKRQLDEFIRKVNLA